MLPLPPEVTSRPPLEPVEWEEQDSLHRPVKKRMDRGRAAPPAPTNGLGAAAAASFLPQRKKRGGE